jgi:kynurenine/2-aminoadipate aminotransferase
VREFYRARRDTFCALASKHLTGLAQWDVPSAGMFVWFSLNGIRDSRILIEEKALDQKVLLVPVQAFSPNDNISSSVRATYSLASPENMDIALQRLGLLVRQYQNKL